jgi:hypothetical protein
MLRLSAFYGGRSVQQMKELGEDFSSIETSLPSGGIIQMDCPLGEENAGKRRLKIRIAFAIFGACVLWLVLGFVVAYFYAKTLDEGTLLKSGQFGDGFNAAATLFTGVALCGTIYALILQQKEIAKATKRLSSN